MQKKMPMKTRDSLVVRELVYHVLGLKTSSVWVPFTSISGLHENMKQIPSGGPRISCFLDPKSNHKMQGS